MDELHAAIAEWRRTVKRQDWEVAHGEEDAILVMALKLIADGAGNPAAVARKALVTQDANHPRWYA